MYMKDGCEYFQNLGKDIEAAWKSMSVMRRCIP